MKTPLIVILLFFLFSLSAFAQKNTLDDADNEYSNAKYFDAIELYKVAYTNLGKKYNKEAKATKATILFKIAECYRMMNDSKQEEQWYKKAIKAKCADSITATQYLNIAINLNAAAMHKDSIIKQQKHYNDSLTHAHVKPDEGVAPKEGVPYNNDTIKK
jgi:hypothetical protein